MDSRRSSYKRRIVLACAAALLAATAPAGSLQAQGRSPGSMGPGRMQHHSQAPTGSAATQNPSALIRDTEIENDLRLIAAPLWRTAGIQPDAVRIALINDPALDLFVADSGILFISTGLLSRIAGADELLGILAQETSYMIGGNSVRLPASLRTAAIRSLMDMAPGAGGTGPARTSGGMNGGLPPAPPEAPAFSRGTEESADRSALTYLDRNKLSAAGLLQFLERLDKEQFLSPAAQDPYLRRHPLTPERIDAVRAHVSASPYKDNPPPPEDTALFDRMRVKLVAFLQPAPSTLARIPDSDKSLPARYARAIATYRVPDLARALPIITALLTEHPDDPYFNELEGHMLFQSGKVAEAVEPYRKAAALLPNAALIKIELAQSALEADDPALLKQALTALNDARRTEPGNPLLWRMLAVAYGRDNQVGMASVALAQLAVLEGHATDAREQARRAEKLLPAGSPGFLMAQDIEAQAVRSGSAQK